MKNVEELSLLIKATYRENQRRTTEALRAIDISPAQSEVLRILKLTGPMSLGELGNYLIAEGGHPSRLVDRMVQSGFVSREAAEDDRRRIEIALTPLGEEKVREIQQVRESIMAASAPFRDKHDVDQIRVILREFLQGSRWLDVIDKRIELSRQSKQHDANAEDSPT